jgi:hypothetical protein
MILRSEIRIQARPEDVMEFFEAMEERQKRAVVYTRVVEGLHIEFAPTSKLFRLLLPRMLFRLSPQGDGLLFVQEVHVRTGPLGAWLNRKGFEAVRQHMKEEGENLKRLLEGGKGGAPPA